MCWIWLILAGIAEVGWACAMKYSAGLTAAMPTAVTLVCYLASALFLAFALKELPLSAAYAMWTGFGIIGTAVAGVVLFNEKLTASHLVCLTFIVMGIAGLKLLTEK